MKLNVAYASDNHYASLLGISMLSLFENNQEFEEIEVYILEDNIEQENKMKLQEIAKPYGRHLVFVPSKSLCKGFKTDQSYNMSSYSRLFLSELQNIDQILYLDCDSIIHSSFQKIWQINLKDYYIAGVLDSVTAPFRAMIGLSQEDCYVNAGMLIMNLAKWREDDLEKKFIDFNDCFHGSVPHHDQGIINGVCKDKVLVLDPQYNLMPPMFTFTAKQIKKIIEINYYTQKQLDFAYQHPVFIHYTNEYVNRPWAKNCQHPLRNLYQHYAELSPWGYRINNISLNRNAKIMKNVYERTPFWFYLACIRLISLRKSRKINLGLKHR